jgi:hypothetical protein
MPKIPFSLNNLKMFLSKEKIDKLVPLFKGLENQAKNVIGEDGFTSLQGVTNGLMTGDLLNGIADTAALKNEEKMINKLKDNYLQINIFFKNLTNNKESSDYSTSIILHFEGIFPEKEISDVFTDLVVFLKSTKAENRLNKKEGGNGQLSSKCSKCSNERIILESDTEELVNKEFCEQVYKKYCCELNMNDDIQNILDDYEASCTKNILYIINSILEDGVEKLNATNNLTTGGANPLMLAKFLNKMPKISGISNLVKNAKVPNLSQMSNLGKKLETNISKYSNKFKDLKQSATEKFKDLKDLKESATEKFKDLKNVTSSSKEPEVQISIEDEISKNDIAELNDVAVEVSGDKYIFDKYRNVLQRLLNEEIKMKSKDLAYKLHNLTHTIFSDYYPYDIIETNIKYFCISIMMKDKNVFFKNRINKIDEIVELVSIDKISDDSLQEIETFEEITDFIVNNINLGFSNKILEKLPYVANKYREVVVRRINKIMTDILNGLSFDTKGGNHPNKRYRKKTQKRVRFSKSVTHSNRHNN